MMANQAVCGWWVAVVNVVACLLSCAHPVAAQQPGKRPQPVIIRSSMDLLGMKFEVTHERPSGRPLPPDLSRARELLIPRVARLRVALPVLWGQQVLSPGDYRLGIVVDDDLQPFLTLKAGHGGVRRRLPLELGSYSSPADAAIVISLTSQQGDIDEVGSLLIRWGAILFQGDFRPVRQRNSKLGQLRLSSFEFPPLPILPRELPVGQLRRGGSGSGEQLTLLLGGDGGPRLRFEGNKYLALLEERRELQQELARQERAKAGKAELRRLQTRLDGVEARLKSLSDDSITREVLGKKVLGEDAPTSGFDLRLQQVEGQPHLSVVLVGVRYHFSL